MRKMILSAFADEYSQDFETQLDFLNRSDIGYLEIRGVNGKNISELSDSEVKSCYDALKKAGIKISSIGSPIGKYPIDDELDSHLETAKRVFDTASQLESKYCRIFSFFIPEEKDPHEYTGRVFDRLEKLLELADKFGVTLCHENEWKVYGETPERSLELYKHFDGRLKCVFDMGNFVLNECRPYPDGYDLLCEHIEYFHIKDSLAAGAIVPPGCGEACIKEILTEHMKRSERDFFVSLEPHLQTFDGFNKLTERSFDNPYKFETKEKAFEEAVRCFRELF